MVTNNKGEVKGEGDINENCLVGLTYLLSLGKTSDTILLCGLIDFVTR